MKEGGRSGTKWEELGNTGLSESVAVPKRRSRENGQKINESPESRDIERILWHRNLGDERHSGLGAPEGSPRELFRFPGRESEAPITIFRIP